jgi:sulfur transfer complex TusBCD TusB component (DsrH family)
MLDQGHSVVLYLLQEAVRFCRPRAACSNTAKLQRLIAKDLAVRVLTGDAELRGVEVEAAGLSGTNGTYESMVDLMTSCDRVVGVL